jgi:hypothetical protein
MDAVEVNRPSFRQIRTTPGYILGRKYGPSGPEQAADPSCQENSRSSIHTPLAVPQTDTGRWGENPKVLVRTLVQELGKM